MPRQAQGRPRPSGAALGGPLSADEPTPPPEGLDLGAFLRALRHEHRHLAPGVDDLQAAQALVCSERWQGWDEHERAAAIASLLARDAAAWSTIQGDFRRFAEESAHPGSPTAGPQPPADPRRRRAVGLGALILAAAVAILVTPIEPVFEMVAPPTTLRGKTPDTVTMRVLEPEARIRAQEPEARIRAQATTTPFGGPLERSWPWLALAAVLGAVLGAAGVALLLALRRRVRDLEGEASADHKERERLDDEHRKSARPVHLYDIDRHLPFDAAAIDDAAALLGRRELAGRGRLLDVAATIAATLRRSGWLTPIFERRRDPARILILVDVESGAHPLLEAAERVLERWQRTGLGLTRYDYAHDPTDGLYLPGRLHQTGDRVRLDELTRTLGGSRLLVLSRLPLLSAIGEARPQSQDFAWADALRPWPRRVLVDLYPPADDPTHDARVAACEARALPRFPLTAAGIRAAAAHLIGRPIAASTRETIHRERAAPAPSDCVWMLWAAAGACVPDASWAQLEDIRKVLLPDALAAGEPRPASHDVARMIRWLTKKYEFEPIKGGGRALALPAGVEDALLCDLRGSADGKRLEVRVRERLKEQLLQRLGRDRGQLSDRQRRFIQLKIDFHEAVLDEAAVEKLCDPKRAGFDPELADLLRPELARQRAGHGVTQWDPDARRRAEERIEAARVRDEGAPARAPGPTIGEALRGLGVAGVVVGVSFVAAVIVLGAGDPKDVTGEGRVQILPAVWEIVAEPPAATPAPTPVACPAGGIDDPPTGGVDPAGSRPLELGPGVPSIKFVALTGGEFTMGSPQSEPGRGGDETRHRVCLSPFEIGVTEVTVAQYHAVTGERPSYCDVSCADDMPVQNVSWEDAVRFANALTRRENAGRPPGEGRTRCYDPETWAWDRACTGYRLPTEAEWEYAARAGTRAAYSFGGDPADICAYGNISDRSRGNEGAECDDGYADLAPVGRFLPNGWGLHDMHGNVWEWVYDGYDAGFYGAEGSKVTGPVNMVTGASGVRALRGGSFLVGPGLARSAVRYGGPPTLRLRSVGLRVVRGRAPSIAD